MSFNAIASPTLSDDGKFLAYSTVPDRGDATGHLIQVNNKKHYTFPGASAPAFHQNWVSFIIKPSLLEQENATDKERKRLTNDLLVVNVFNGKQQVFEKVDRFSLGVNYLAFIQTPSKTNKEKEKQQQPLTLTLIHLPSGEKTQLEKVTQFVFKPDSDTLFYAQQEEKNSGLYVWKNSVKQQLDSTPKQHISQLHFAHDGNTLAYLIGDQSVEEQAYQLKRWQDKQGISQIKTPASWYISRDAKLEFSEDNKRLFVGMTPLSRLPKTKPEASAVTREQLNSAAHILKDTQLVLWHDQDPLIKPQEIKHQSDLSTHPYYALLKADSTSLLPLTNTQVDTLELENNPNALIALSESPYYRDKLFDGDFADLYHVSLQTGKQQKAASRVSDSFSHALSPSGQYLAFFQHGQFHVFDANNGTTTPLWRASDTAWIKEEHDYPSEAGDYGIAGWYNNEQAVLVYDKYDIWALPLDGKDGTNLTKGAGRKNFTQFRVLELDEKPVALNGDETLLLTSYHDRLKHHGYYHLNLKTSTLKPLLEQKKRFRFVAKAKNADVLIYSREDFQEFPDLWVSDLNPANGEKVTDANPQIKEFDWGNAELVNWRSAKGKPLQGVLIKPANYQEGKRYPVLVYYYRLISQRLYHFNQMKVNHRPNFPLYTSNGYAIFLPDIKFDVGTPGKSSADALIPGVQKLIDMGVADPDAIGLHGHSWSGYQTAQVITQTDIFKAAVAGAPVTNMTSAYSGIRLKSGRARQFQYEKGQSRIGKTLWQAPQLYIENSPVFYADRINTPLMIQFGDVDGAVPWQQGIELYLAMRRLNKPVIFLQYKNEPHHLKQYANKLDYSLKMKAFFDYHLKGMPAEDWILQGQAYAESN